MTTDEPVDPERRAQLNRVKLAALVRGKWGIEVDTRGVGTGAAVVADGVAYVLLDGDIAGIGAALALAWRAGASSIHAIVDDGGATLARQASAFATPIAVWHVNGRELDAVEAVPVPDAGPVPDAPELAALLRTAGLDVVVEGNHLAGEFAGLEVARILHDDEGVPGLSVGVGRFDRELTAMLHGDLTPEAALARVAEQISIIRVPDAPRHPLRDLVPERWLRSCLLADPATIGCASLAAAPGPQVRDKLRERGIAVATGTRLDGTPVVVATTIGAYLDAIPEAADARSHLDPTATLLVVMPERDKLPVTERLIADLVDPAELVTVTDDWRC